MKPKLPKGGAVALLLFGLSFVCLYLAFTYQLPTVKQLRVEQTTGKQTLAGKQDKLTKLKQAAAEIETKKEQLKLLDIAVPNAEDTVPVMLLQTESLANKSGVKLGSFTHALKPTEKPMPITLSVSGSLPGIKSYIDALYTNLRIISINSISLSGVSVGSVDPAVPSSSAATEITAQIQGVTTIIPAPATTPVASGASAPASSEKEASGTN